MVLAGWLVGVCLGIGFTYRYNCRSLELEVQGEEWTSFRGGAENLGCAVGLGGRCGVW